jgi:hypothetical protein
MASALASALKESKTTCTTVIEAGGWCGVAFALAAPSTDAEFS